MKLLPRIRKNVPAARPGGQDAIYSLQQEINQLFDQMMRDFETPFFASEKDVIGSFVLCVDMHETEKDVTVTAEIPGIDEKDISVTLSRDILTISGEKKTEKSEDTKGFYKMERVYGSFRRSLPVPAGIDPDKVEATFKNGVLTITLAKSPETQPSSNQIPIKKG